MYEIESVRLLEKLLFLRHLQISDALQARFASDTKYSVSRSGSEFLRPSLDGANKSPLIGQILDPYEVRATPSKFAQILDPYEVRVTPSKFAQMKQAIFAHVNPALRY